MAIKDKVAAVGVAVATLKTDVSAAIARVSEDVQNLKDQLAAGDPVTEEALDAILADLQAVDQTVNTLDPDPSFPPAAPTV